MRYLATFGVMLILAGCGNAKWTSIYREYKISDAHGNGVIDEQSFVKVSNRYVDAMVTLLAIEQVTSPTAGDAPLVIRTSTASADTGVTGQSGPDGSSPPPVGSVDQTDQQPDESSPPPADAAVPIGGGDKPQGGGGSASGKSTTKGEASAGGGDVNIDISGLKGGQVDQSVAAEVRSMVSIFLEKDSRDQCLDRIGRFADRLEYGSEKPSDDEKKLIDNFTQLCFDLIRTSVGAHIWGPRADDTGADDTGKAPAELMQPQLLIPKEES